MLDEELDPDEELRKQEEERRKMMEEIERKHAAQKKGDVQMIEEAKSPPHPSKPDLTTPPTNQDFRNLAAEKSPDAD